MMLLPMGVWAEDYGLTVGGVVVTDANASNIIGDNIEGSVSYDAATNTLTLNKATIKNYSGISCTGDLTLSVIGEDNIVLGAISSTKAGGATLTLQHGDENTANLTYNLSSDSETASGFISVVYDGMYLSAENRRDIRFSPSLQYYADSNGNSQSRVLFSSSKTYELWVGETKVTEANKTNILGSTGTATATFDEETNTLSLNGMTLTGTSIYDAGIISRLPTLVISINGENTITPNDTCTAIRADMEGAQTLTIVKGSTGCSLYLVGNRPIRDFDELTHTGLYWDTDCSYKNNTGMKLMTASGTEASNVTLSETEYYNIHVGGVPVTSANASNITGDGKVSFNNETNTLTLNGANFNMTESVPFVQSSLESLTVVLASERSDIGYNNVPSYPDAVFISSVDNAILTFKATGNGELYINDNITLYSGFSAPVYEDNLIYSQNDDWSSISRPAAPSIWAESWDDYGNPTVNISSDIDGGTISYSTDGTNFTDYTATFTLTQPGTVYARVTVNEAISETVVGKYFGFTETELTMTYGGETSTVPAITPTLGEEEVEFSINDEDVATLEGTTVTATGIGTTVLLANINSEQDGFVMLNNPDWSPTVDITVLPSAPIVSLEEGTYDGAQTVTLSSEYVAENPETASIRYYFGTDSSVNPLTYNEALTINESTTINAWVEANDNSGNTYRSDTVTVEYTISQPYGLMVNGIAVYESNRQHILGENNQTVQFDGENTLILNNATGLTGIETTLENLTIYLKGTNVMEGTTIVSSSLQSMIPEVTFATDDRTPGVLNFRHPAGTNVLTDPSEAFSGVEVKYKNDLTAILTDDGSGVQEVTIKPLLSTIVDEIENKDVYVVGDLTGKTIPSNGIVLDNVLYTLAADGDGVVTTESSVALTTAMNQDNMTTLANNLANGTVVPGTQAFAEAFSGLTFKLPAGTGKITVNARLAGTGVLNVKIGTNAAKTFTHTDAADFTNLEIPFACTVPTYVLIYNTTPAPTTTPSRSDEDRRAPGRKETTTAEIKGLSVNASSVESTPEPALTPRALAASDITIVSNHVIVSDGDIESIDDATVFNTLEGTSITYVDLTETKIISETVDRSVAPYDKIPAAAMIYLPAGNKVVPGTKNVIIGTVCQEMELSDDGHPFEAAKDFLAVHASQARDYTDFVGKNCTVFLPFAIDSEKAATLGVFYQLQAVAGNTITMESVDQTEANKPYMFKPSQNTVSADMVMVEKDIPEAPSVGKTSFEGTYTSQTICSDASYNYYCFMSSGVDAGKFVRVVDNSMNVKPFRAFVKTDNTSSARELVLNIGGGGATAISLPQINIDQSEIYYDLSGHRYIGKPVKRGIYIHNGRKEVVK